MTEASGTRNGHDRFVVSHQSEAAPIINIPWLTGPPSHKLISALLCLLMSWQPADKPGTVTGGPCHKSRLAAARCMLADLRSFANLGYLWHFRATEGARAWCVCVCVCVCVWWGVGRFLDADSSSVWGIAFSPKKNVHDQVLFHTGFFVCLFLLLFVSSDPQDVFRLVVCLHGVFSFSSAVRTLRLSDCFDFCCCWFFGLFCALCKSAFHYNFSFAATNTEGSSAEAK